MQVENVASESEFMTLSRWLMSNTHDMEARGGTRTRIPRSFPQLIRPQAQIVRRVRCRS